jgi:hypothetical protein
MSHHESAARGIDGRMIDRMLFFSDAVFAIVLTLLAIELHAPEVHGPDQELWGALAGMVERFLAFAMSFALIALWWAVHMRVMRKLIQFDWLTAIVNLFVLCTMTVLPFATSVFGENTGSLPALQFYWWVSAAAATSMTLLFIVTTRGKGRLVGGIEPGEWWFRLSQSVAPVIAFGFGIYFCATGQEWPARFAALIMFPVMMFGRLFYRPTKPA